SNANEGDALIRLSNPLSSELDALRPTMLFGALQAVAHNINRQQRDLRLFERGRVYTVNGNERAERETLAITLTGHEGMESWRAKSRPADRADGQAEIESLLAALGLLQDATWKDHEHPLLNACAELHVAGRRIGVLGTVRPEVLKRADVAQLVHHAELDEEALLDA